MRITPLILTLLVFLSAVAQEIFVDKFIVAIIALSFIIESRKQLYLLNPFSLFFFTPFSLLIYWPVSDNFMLELSHKTYFLCILHFVLIYAIFRLKLNRVRLNNARPARPFATRTIFLINVLVYLFGILGLFSPFLSSFAWILILFSLAVMYSRDRKIFIIFLLLYCGIVVKYFYISKLFLLTILLFILILAQRRRSIWRMRVFFYTKSFLFGALLMAMFFKYGNKDRGYADTDTSLSYYVEQGVEWTMGPTWFLPYMYVTTPWANLQYVITYQDNLTYGLWLVKPLTGYLGIDFSDFLQLQSFSSFNTFTFIAVFFKDFGYVGSLVGTFIIGHLIAYIYCLYCKFPFGLEAGLYSIFSLALIQMYFSNHFLMQSYPITAFLIYILIVTLRRIFWSNGKRSNNVLWPAAFVGKGNSKR